MTSKTPKISHFILTVIFIISFEPKIFTATSNQIPAYDCVTGFHYFCQFSHIYLNKTHFQFEPDADINDVRKIRLINSYIPVLSEDLCTTFPNIIIFEATSIYIEEFVENAFENCTNMKKLDLRLNHITKLPENIFNTNQELTELWLHSNKLEAIDSQFSNISKLETLSLGNNLIKNLSIDKMQGLDNLAGLFLDSNELTNLNADEIIRAFPSLRTINYSNNPIPCTIVKELNSKFKDENIDIEVIHIEKKVDFKKGIMDGVICKDE